MVALVLIEGSADATLKMQSLLQTIADDCLVVRHGVCFVSMHTITVRDLRDLLKYEEGCTGILVTSLGSWASKGATETANWLTSQRHSF